MRGRAIFVAGLALLAMEARAQHAEPWLLQNFADRAVFTLSNPTDRPLKQVVVLHASKQYSFPGSVAVAISNGSVLPAQIDEVEGGGVDVMAEVPAHGQSSISVYYSSTLHDQPMWPAQVSASHAYGYNQNTAAIESTLIGYRTYGGFMLDVQPHGTGQAGLYNALLGYSSTSHPPVEGRDIVHYGRTLGLGGIYIRSGDSVYQPPFSTPDYTHKQPAPDEPVYRVLSTGPLRAVIESDLPHWVNPAGTFSVNALYEIRANEACARVTLRLKPLQVTSPAVAGAGILVLPQGSTQQRDGVLAVSGVQDPVIGKISLGAAFPANSTPGIASLRTADGENRVFEFAEALRAGGTLRAQYKVAAAWERGGAGEPMQRVMETLKQCDESLTIGPARFEHTAHPEDLEKEPR